MTVIFLCLRTVPEPWQVEQGVWMIFPVPWQRVQGALVAKVKAPPPRWMRMTPVPRQSGQVSAVVPLAQPVPLQASQVSEREREISFSQPKAASSKETLTAARRVSPFRGAVGF